MQCVVVDGERSSALPVTSGVPQGSVVGPMLFLVYINDLPDCVSSHTRLFADDTIIYRHIRSEKDSQVLQNDLLKLQEWEKLWQMEFHPGKCQVLRFTRRRKPISYNYYLHGLELEVVPEAKYLGVTLTSDLRWGSHIDRVTQKANQTLGFVRRNLQVSSPAIKQRAYFGLIRPKVEYASTVWNPFQKKQINKIEMIQRRAARWTLSRYHNTSSVSDMVDQLGWRSLQDRRTDACLCMFYKMCHGLVTIGPQCCTSLASRPSRYSHPLRYIPVVATREVFRYSFYPQTIFVWNALPAPVVAAPTLDAFRARVGGLDHHAQA